MVVDLNTCKAGDKLISSLGMELTYVKRLENSFYDHEVKYPDGSAGNRTNDGYVFRHKRMPEYDHDIVKVIHI